MMRTILILLFLTALPLFAESHPDKAARQFYDFLEKYAEHAPKHLNQAQEMLTEELYSQLTRAYAKDPNTGDFLDFDPFSNTQMGATGYRLGPAKLVAGQAKIPVTALIEGGGKVRYTCVLSKVGADWRVANLVYAPDFNLLSVLRSLNQ